jgi:hypothetical protein
MVDYYYTPEQYRLREFGDEVLTDPEILGLGRQAGIPLTPVAVTIGVGLFLAYTPFFQPSPPAKTPDAFPIYNVGRFVV